MVRLLDNTVTHNRCVVFLSPDDGILALSHLCFLPSHTITSTNETDLPSKLEESQQPQATVSLQQKTGYL